MVKMIGCLLAYLLYFFSSLISHVDITCQQKMGFTEYCVVGSATPTKSNSLLINEFPKQIVDQQANSFLYIKSVETVADNIDAGSGGISVDKHGVIYTSDFGSELGGGGKGGDRIFRVSIDGKVSKFCSGQRGASGSTFGKDGKLYQANIRGNVINTISEKGEVEEFCKVGLASPVGLTIDSEGNLYVCNCASASIQKISPEGKSTTLVRDRLLSCPNGITIDNEGTLYVSNFMNGDVIRVTKDGKISRLATLPGNNNGHIVFHRGVLFVVARSAHQIYRVTLDGQSQLVAGSGKQGHKNGPATEAEFSLPNGICVSPDGKSLFINEVAKIDGGARNLAPTRIRRLVLEDVED